MVLGIPAADSALNSSYGSFRRSVIKSLSSRHAAEWPCPMKIFVPRAGELCGACASGCSAKSHHAYDVRTQELNVVSSALHASVVRVVAGVGVAGLKISSIPISFKCRVPTSPPKPWRQLGVIIYLLTDNELDARERMSSSLARSAMVCCAEYSPPVTGLMASRALIQSSLSSAISPAQRSSRNDYQRLSCAAFAVELADMPSINS